MILLKKQLCTQIDDGAIERIHSETVVDVVASRQLRVLLVEVGGLGIRQEGQHALRTLVRVVALLVALNVL